MCLRIWQLQCLCACSHTEALRVLIEVFGALQLASGVQGARESTALFGAAANLGRAGLNQPPARASTSGAWQDPSAPLPTEDCSGGSPAAGARLPSCCLSAMAVFALFRLPVRCELLVCHAIIHEQSTVQFLEVVVA